MNYGYQKSRPSYKIKMTRPEILLYWIVFPFQHRPPNEGNAAPFLTDDTPERGGECEGEEEFDLLLWDSANYNDHRIFR